MVAFHSFYLLLPQEEMAPPQTQSLLLTADTFLMGVCFLSFVLPIKPANLAASLSDIYRAGVLLEIFSFLAFFLLTCYVLFGQMILNYSYLGGNFPYYKSYNKYPTLRPSGVFTYLVVMTICGLLEGACWFCFLGLLLLLPSVVCMAQVVLNGDISSDKISVVIVIVSMLVGVVSCVFLVAVGALAWSSTDEQKRKVEEAKKKKAAGKSRRRRGTRNLKERIISKEAKNKLAFLPAHSKPSCSRAPVCLVLKIYIPNLTNKGLKSHKITNNGSKKQNDIRSTLSALFLFLGCSLAVVVGDHAVWTH